MNSRELISLGFKHTLNAVAEEVYIKIGVDMTKPVAFYGLVNQRCNVKCRYCEYWRLPEYTEELSIAEWQAALLSVKEFVGNFSINFSGGEPFIKPGFLDLFAWCYPNGIRAGVTTNGSALTEANAAKVVFRCVFEMEAPPPSAGRSHRVPLLKDGRIPTSVDFPVARLARRENTPGSCANSRRVDCASHAV